MARVLTSETRMRQREQALERETLWLRRIARIEWAAIVALVAAGIGWYVWQGAAGGLTVAALALFIGVGHRLKISENERDRRFQAAGRRGEHRVAAALAQELPDEYAVINDAEISIGRQRAQYDHIVVGPNGIFAVETKNWRGRVTGRAASPFLRIYGERGGVRAARNPLPQCRRQARVLRGFIARTPRPDAPVTAVLAAGADDGRWEIEGADVPIVALRDLAGFIRGRAAGRPLTPAEVDAIAREIGEQHAA